MLGFMTRLCSTALTNILVKPNNRREYDIDEALKEVVSVNACSHRQIESGTLTRITSLNTGVQFIRCLWEEGFGSVFALSGSQLLSSILLNAAAHTTSIMAIETHLKDKHL